MTHIRSASIGDVEALRDLFRQVYGENYPFAGFYDTEWLTKSLYDDNMQVLVAETKGRLVATGTLVLNVGHQDDLIGELGRLVALPGRSAGSAARAVVTELIQRLATRALFGLSEVRTVHHGAQRLAEEAGWKPVGFEPMKYQLAHRESMLTYAAPQPMALELRRNNPRVIQEIAPLAQTALGSLGLPLDVIVEDESDGYATDHAFQTERLCDQGITPLLRIERGRVRHREIFGHFSLANGFFRIAGSQMHYLVARDGAAILGAVGFSFDPIDRRLRIIELIEFDDAVKGYLLAEVDALARTEFNAVYQEVDVSAYSPAIQRTFERLGYLPVAYLPSMVFAQVERLDIVRMAKLNCAYEPGPLRLLESGARLRQLVERGFEDRAIGMTITENVRNVPLFLGVPDGDLTHLARICTLRSYAAGETLMRPGDQTDRLYVLMEGSAEVRFQGRVLGSIHPGEACGEMALVEHQGTRSAEVVLQTDARVIEMDMARLGPVLEARPRLSHAILYNLARGLSRKLRATRG